ncbi:unnamed protein product, partial [Symbiodinium sp. CCMP2456]
RCPALRKRGSVSSTSWRRRKLCLPTRITKVPIWHGEPPARRLRPRLLCMWQLRWRRSRAMAARRLQRQP